MFFIIGVCLVSVWCLFVSIGTGIILTHSSCSSLRIAGMLVADGGRGLTKGLAAWGGHQLEFMPFHQAKGQGHTRLPFISSSSSSVSGSPVTGSEPFCCMNLMTSLFSNTCLETGESTGSSGTSLQTADRDKVTKKGGGTRCPATYWSKSVP